MFNSDKIKLALSKYIVEISDDQIKSASVEIHKLGVENSFFVHFIVTLNRELIPKKDHTYYDQLFLESNFMNPLISFFKMVTPYSGGIIKFSVID